MIGLWGPGVLYLVMRMQSGARPYGAHWIQLLDLEIWFQVFMGVVRQCAFILPLAAWGTISLWRRGRVGDLLLGFGTFFGVLCFLQCDDLEYLGLARFQLLFFAPLFWWAWIGITAIRMKSRAAAISAALLIGAGNLFVGPGLGRERSVWADARHEQFIPFQAALSRCIALDPEVNNVLAIDCIPGHGYGLIAQWLGRPELIVRVKESNGQSVDDFLGDDALTESFVLWKVSRGATDIPGKVGLYELEARFQGDPVDLLLYKKVPR